MSTENTSNELKNMPDQFEQLLQKELSNQFPYLEDNGFSNRVMGKIKPKKTAKLGLIAKLPLMISGLIALIVFSYFPWREILTSSYSFFRAIDIIDILTLCLIFCISSVTALSYWAFTSKD